MFKQFLLGLFLIVFTTVKAQELNCSVTVNADKIAVSNNRIFQTLENSLTEFVNQKKWTDIKFKDHERIKCSFTLLLTEQTGTNSYKGSIQIQASRPVFNSTYYSPIFNYKDDSFSFNYTEYQPLNYNPNGFDSNLVSVITYYTYMILGIYVDSFDLKGGEPYLNTALAIVNQAQQSGYIGWENSKINISRFTLVDQLLASENELYRELFYNYHYECLDAFERNQKIAAGKIVKKLLILKDIYDANPNNIAIRLFTDAKSDEIVNMFRKNRNIDTAELVSVLKRVSPNNSKKWRQIYTN
ncbi:DUF4835 family protein [Wenyingzhuangia sp. 2_MG-2023]|uniref:type IX secretion system protein PorD n=1 Tax=Wenyingzhuangia sp. 2_MG-2023 TaxID=3062639 RepID=UPI0026E2CB40|nr:DUF4835 family protein [Wenyingzhuangia sp. 2_MG-2023]MDO6736947.1 DUF4835 family protein [Wenyingzhuangia sp. 2_MG-2023]MDO6801883.1 DUF4835 family protein [Wenyingzhuangia sp. 1_MG-2023]